MGKLSRQHMKKRIDRHEDRIAGHTGDMWITLGMYLAEVALANSEGYGKTRLGRVEANVHALTRVEVVAGAEQWTKDYSYNLAHGFTRVLDRLDQIYGYEHTAAMREWLKDNGWI